MIDIYGGQTPNVLKVLIALEEMELAYRRVPLDILSGEQYRPEFLAISPNSKVPAMLDHDPADGSAPLALMESGSMLIYLAEKTGRYLPLEARQKADITQWIMWQMAGQGPMLGQLHHFRNYAPEPIPYAIERYAKEASRLYRVLDTRLEGRDYIAGDYSIADMACFPWLIWHEHQGIAVDDYPNLSRWFHSIASRPEVRRATGDVPVGPPPSFTQEQRAVLFSGAKQ